MNRYITLTEGHLHLCLAICYKQIRALLQGIEEDFLDHDGNLLKDRLNKAATAA